MFDVIPVIDVRNSVAVRAIAGERANYKPLVTPLSPSSDPCAVMDGLMALHPFPVIYLADLDSIEGRGAKLELTSAIVDRVEPCHPAAMLRIDRDPTASRIRNVPGPGCKAAASTRPTSAGLSLWVDNGARSRAQVAALLANKVTCAVIGSETGITCSELGALRDTFGERIVLSLDFRPEGFVGNGAVRTVFAGQPRPKPLLQFGHQGGRQVWPL